MIIREIIKRMINFFKTLTFISLKGKQKEPSIIGLEKLKKLEK